MNTFFNDTSAFFGDRSPLYGVYVLDGQEQELLIVSMEYALYITSIVIGLEFARNAWHEALVAYTATLGHGIVGIAHLDETR